MFQVEVFWVVTPFSVVVGSWRWRQHGPLKRRYPTTTLHSVTTQKTLTYKVQCYREKWACALVFDYWLLTWSVVLDCMKWLNIAERGEYHAIGRHHESLHCALLLDASSIEWVPVHVVCVWWEIWCIRLQSEVKVCASAASGLGTHVTNVSSQLPTAVMALSCSPPTRRHFEQAMQMVAENWQRK
jgi:hypothetical protein